MKKIIAMSSLVLVSQVSANDLFDANASIESGYRVDKLSWSTGFPGYEKASELSYDDIKIYEIGGHFDFKLKSGKLKGLYSEFDVSYGKIDSGKGRDKDWEDPNNRSKVTSDSYSDLKNSNVKDYSVGFGYEIPLKDTNFFITPLVGYSFHEQNINEGGGATTLTSQYDSSGNYVDSVSVNDPFPGKVSSYDTEWKGPWIGTKLQYVYTDNIFTVRAQYHKVDYKAVADWKLRDEFQHPKSFTHSAKGNGYSLELGYTKILSPSWSIGTSMAYKKFETDSGKLKTFYRNGDLDSQKLNEAEWESYSANVGITYKF